MITIKVIPNLLKPGHREEAQMEWRAELPLSAYVPPAYNSEHFRAVLSTRGVVPFAQWGEVFPRADEEIIIAPEIRASVFAGAGLLGALLIGIVANVATQATMQALFPASEITPNYGSDGDASSSPTYGWNGIQNTADVDVPPAVALRLLDHATGPDLRLTLVKDADHRFSTPDCLALIAASIAEVLARAEGTGQAG